MMLTLLLLFSLQHHTSSSFFFQCLPFLLCLSLYFSFTPFGKPKRRLTSHSIKLYQLVQPQGCSLRLFIDCVIPNKRVEFLYVCVREREREIHFIHSIMQSFFFYLNRVKVLIYARTKKFFISV